MSDNEFRTIPAFIDTDPRSSISEVALRVVVELPEWKFFVVGTAVLITGHLALTAGHVVDFVLQKFGTSCELTLYQVLPGPAYRVWNVSRGWRCPTSDIALLQLAATPREYGDGGDIVWKTLGLRATAPIPGSKVIAFGYREGQIACEEDSEGVHHIVLNDKGTTSIGEVGQVFAQRRDTSMLNFPCFEVRAQFSPGMSGGWVVDDTNRICGLICAGYSFEDNSALPLSYAATLWPMLTMNISGDRGDKYPRGVWYPVIDLALDGHHQGRWFRKSQPRTFPWSRVAEGISSWR